MLRFLRLLFLGVLAIVLVAICSANFATVELRFLPQDLGTLLGVDWTLRLPLFLVVIGGVVAGLALGFVWEWLRESKLRADASAHRRELRRIKTQEAKAGPKDEVLALVENKSAAR